MLRVRGRGPRIDAVSSIPAAEDVLDPDEDVYDLPTVSDLLGIPVTKVHQQLRDGQLIAVRRNRILVVPKIFFDDNGHVGQARCPDCWSCLRDGGYHDTEIVRWLFTPDESLTITTDGRAERVSNARPVDATAFSPGTRGAAPRAGARLLTAGSEPRPQPAPRARGRASTTPPRRMPW